jgi:hypothetical protein
MHGLGIDSPIALNAASLVLAIKTAVPRAEARCRLSRNPFWKWVIWLALGACRKLVKLVVPPRAKFLILVTARRESSPLKPAPQGGRICRQGWA